MFKQTVDVIIRSFKAGIGYGKPKINQADFDLYKSTLIDVISNIKACPQVRNIYVVTNGDPNSPLAESPYEDESTPTTRIVNRHFNLANIKTLICQDWGLNAGSSGALNIALQTMVENSTTPPRWVLVLSKEIQMNSAYLHEAISASNLYNLFTCGFYRQNHWERFQWGFAQNTACLWDYKILGTARFHKRCDGVNGQYLDIDDQKILLAGMEDFYLQLQILKRDDFSLRWGMVLNEDPLFWDLSGKSLKEMQMHIQKVARQEMVMRKWVEELFPDSNWYTVMNRFFSRRISL